MIRLSLVVAFALAALGACSKANPYYCEGNPDNNCTLDANLGPDGPMACMVSDDCPDTLPVCNGATGVCVACTDGDPGTCSNPTPVCSAANTCEACVAHDQCPGDACLPSGACGDDTTVAYVAMTGTDAGTCTHAAPCKTIGFAATVGKPVIKIETDLDEAVVLQDVELTILAEPGTAIQSSTGTIFTISGSSKVHIEDLVMRDATGTNAHGISVPLNEPVELVLERVYVIGNQGYGLYVQGGTLTMSRSVVSGNDDGGANIGANFSITNTLFVQNGNGDSNTGGVTLAPGTMAEFAFNTVAANQSSLTYVETRGINCTGAMTVSSTIISDNKVSPLCTVEYSLFDQGTAVTGTNKTGLPKFKNVITTNVLAPDYFRIQADSDAIDGAATQSSVMIDIDGDPRPQNGVRDIGADEYM